MTSPGLPPGVEGLSRPGFSLDLGKCVGCGACVLACRIENQLPSDVSWRRILQVNQPRIRGGPTYHLSVACHHCENPPCAKVCPSGALKKREDGLVLVAAELCIGCRYCEMACPFGAPAFDSVSGVMTKCHLCHHRSSVGSSPACVVACPTGALGLIPTEGSEGGPERGFGPATGVPGFSDPTGAEPGFWVTDPCGSIRFDWFLDLKALLGLQGREPDEEE